MGRCLRKYYFLNVKASRELFVHHIVNLVLFRLNIEFNTGKVPFLLLQVIFPHIPGDFLQFFLGVGLAAVLNLQNKFLA